MATLSFLPDPFIAPRPCLAGKDTEIIPPPTPPANLGLFISLPCLDLAPS